ncbi:unnamed protein product [Prorocentrum cordatum]|uniref:Uncharacterized protein n=1 Tax=Prorocentrum cordatum TaxID=2364126 RepID=A0ABN9YCZ5_9DINO|nr:unnamed protein product [Polarella glacialis]
MVVDRAASLRAESANARSGCPRRQGRGRRRSKAKEDPNALKEPRQLRADHSPPTKPPHSQSWSPSHRTSRGPPRWRGRQVPHGRAAAALRARPVQQAGGCCASGGHAEREPTEAELIRAFFEERGRDTVRGPTGRGSATIAAWGPRRCSSAPLSGQLPTDEAQAHIQNAC